MLRCVKIQAANKLVPRTTSHRVKYNILKGKCEWNHPPPVGTTTGPKAETWATPCTVTTVRGTLWLQANWVDNTDSCTVGSIIIWAGNSMYVPVRQIVDMMTDRQQAGCKATKLGKNGHKANRWAPWHQHHLTTPVFELRAFSTRPITALNTQMQRESADLEIWQRNWATPKNRSLRGKTHY